MIKTVCRACNGKGVMDAPTVPGSAGGWIDRNNFSNSYLCGICKGSGYVEESDMNDYKKEYQIDDIDFKEAWISWKRLTDNLRRDFDIPYELDKWKDEIANVVWKMKLDEPDSLKEVEDLMNQLYGVKEYVVNLSREESLSIMEMVIGGFNGVIGNLNSMKTFLKFYHKCH